MPVVSWRRIEWDTVGDSVHSVLVSVSVPVSGLRLSLHPALTGTNRTYGSARAHCEPDKRAESRYGVFINYVAAEDADG
jgi:hypothetical protein